MKIIWFTEAEKEYLTVLEYLGKQAAIDLYNEVLQATMLISIFPKIGKRDDSILVW